MELKEISKPLASFAKEEQSLSLDITTTPWSSIGYLTFKRTYSRALDDTGSRTEEFTDVIDRVVKACNTQLHCGFSKEEEAQLRNYMLSLKGIVAGRFLWQLGSKTVDKLGLASLQNCAAVVVDEPVRPFTWAMDMLMLGAGVGFNIQKKHIEKIPLVKENFKTPTRINDAGADFIVPDSREGWVALLGKVLKSAFLAHESGKQTFTYSTQLVRGKGVPIKGFGGVTSGPEELVWGINEIGKLLEKRAGRKLRPIDALDIMNIIGHIVVSGNVRRAAEIAIGDPDDIEFLLAKRWDLGNIPSWRAMSNNSVACDNIKDLHEFFWEGYKGKGEPYGLINFKLSRKVGRLGETEYPDPNIEIFNPCFAPETLVVTDKGLFPIEDLVGKTVNVWSNNKWTSISNFRVTGENKKIIKITLHDGSEIRVTPNHTMILEDGSRKLASELKLEEKLAISDVEVHGDIHSQGAYLKGFLCGDGTITCDRPLLYLYPPKYVCQDRLVASAKELPNRKINTNAKADLYFVDQESKGKQRKAMLGLAPKKLELTSWAAENKLRLPSEIFTWDKESKCEFISGLLDSDGTASDTANGFMYQVASVSKEFLLGFQTLLKTIGVQSKLSLMRSAGVSDFNDGYGEYKTQDCYRLTISQKSAIRLAQQVSFSRLTSFKDKQTVYNLKSKRAVIVDIQDDGTEEYVYCCTVPDTHSLSIGVGITIGQCSEQGLNNYETCCLSEIYLPNISSKQELLNVAKLLYRINKHSLLLPCHNKETENVVHDNLRMGLGITGYLESTEEQKSWLSPTYLDLRDYDKQYSKKLGVNVSIKLCTVKPSGTLSLLPGVTPGVHPAFAKFMIRRIRIASNHPLVKVCRDHGYKVEYARNFDGTNDHTTVVVEFPFRHKDTAILAKDVTAIQQLEYVKELQTAWSDNAVSCTVYYKPEELEGIQEYLKKNYKNTIKAVSFLLHSDHGFDQAPLEEINEEQYNTLVTTTIPITSIEQADIGLGEECAGGACPVR